MDPCGHEMENLNAHGSAVRVDQRGGKGIQERVVARLGVCGEKTRLNSSLNRTCSRPSQDVPPSSSQEGGPRTLHVGGLVAVSVTLGYR